MPVRAHCYLGFVILFLTDSAGNPSTSNQIARVEAQSKLAGEIDPGPQWEVLPDLAASADEPAKKDKAAKNGEAAKKDEPVKPAAKLPPRKGEMKDLETDKDAAEKKLLRQPTVTAEVKSVSEKSKSLRLKLTIPYVKISERHLQSYYNAQMSLAQAKTVQSAMNAQNRMAQAAAQIYQLDKIYKEVEWVVADELKVRLANPPPQLDDKGRAKRYTKKELQDLKGNDKLPGYPAKFSQIKSGQIVQVTLVQIKNAPQPVKRGKDAEEETPPDNHPRISMIIILADPKN